MLQMEQSDKPIRTTIFLTKDLKNKINELQKENGYTSLVDVVRSSVNLFHKLSGKEIYIKTKDGFEQVIIV